MEKNLHRLFDVGSLEHTINGPYEHNETRLRAISYACLYWKYIWETQQTTKAKEQLSKATDYILSSRVDKYTLSFRKHAGKDSCNGLVGQAWGLEALRCCYEVLKRAEIKQLAEEVICSIKFDFNQKLWRIIDVYGEDKGVDDALNHQIWYAMAISYWRPKSEELKSFIDNFHHQLVQIEGIIYHPTKSANQSIMNPSLIETILFYYRNLKKLKFSWYSTHLKNYNKKMLIKSYGYQSFNLLAMAILCTRSNAFDILYRESISSWITSAERNERRLENNPYGVPYNVFFLEMWVAKTLMGYDVCLSDYILRQLDAIEKNEILDKNLYKYRFAELFYACEVISSDKINFDEYFRDYSCKG